MGIYSDTSFYQASAPIFNDTLDTIREDPSIPVYEDKDLLEEGYVAIGVMNENYNTMMNAIGVSELSALERTGEELVYTEGVLGSIAERIKSFLKKVWERIKSLFKHFMMIIDGYAKNDKDFCNKYRKQIMAYHNISDFTFKGYKWTIDQGEISAAVALCKFDSIKAMTFKGGSTELSNLNLSSATPKNAAAGDNPYNKVLENFDDSFEIVRGSILGNFHKGHGKTGSYTAEEFRKELRACLRSGEDTKEELDDKDIDVHNMFEELYTSKQTKKTANDTFKEAKKSIEDDIKTIDRLQRDNINNAPHKEKSKVIDKETEIKQAIPSGKTGETAILGWLKANLVDQAKKDDVTGKESGSTTFDTDKACAQAAAAGGIKVTDYTKEQGENFSRLLTLAHKAMTAAKECLLAIQSAVLDALKERSRQFKACLTKIVYHKSSNESAYTESTSYSHPANFITDIEFK